MTMINLAGAALIISAGGVSQLATQDAGKVQETVKIRIDGDTSRPPMNTEEQARAEYEKHLENVNKVYDDLPDDEKRPYDQPKRNDDGGVERK